MPKKKPITSDEPLITRPQRNMVIKNYCVNINNHIQIYLFIFNIAYFVIES